MNDVFGRLLMKNKLIFLFITGVMFGFANHGFSQNLHYARCLVDTLASTAMFGRGYVNEGNSLASGYIASEMERIGLKPFNSTFFQSFDMPVNTFPDTVEFSINGNTIVPGRDFTVASYSPDIKGVYKLKTIKSKVFSKPSRLNRLSGKDFSKTFFLIDKADIPKERQRMVDSLVRTNYVHAAGFVISQAKEKLMWSVSQAFRQKSFPVFEVLKSAIPRNPGVVECNVNAEFFAGMPVRNVVGFIPGTELPDSFIVISAHYDHLGMMGRNALFPGANDNASGIAMMLDMARHFALAENRPRCSMAFLAFAGEEAGLLGSQFYVDHPLFPLKQISFLLNLDMVGTGSEGVTVVNGNVFKKQFELLTDINHQHNYLLKVAERGESCNSDHCPFYKAGVPAVFIYSMGKEFREYHNIFDRSEQLPLTKYEDIFRLLRDFVLAYHM